MAYQILSFFIFYLRFAFVITLSLYSNKPMSYLCPLCHKPLNLENRSFGCANNHQFDIAKEGYVNLLPVQHKASKDPGDNKEMMKARRAFLEQGYYLPLRDKINALLDTAIKDSHLKQSANTTTKILDIGCGEGYYTHSFKRENAQVFGLDISKTMIRSASKSYKDCDFLVASSQRLPFADNSLDTIVRIYAPCEQNELNRVLKENGIVLTVTPAPRHLYQLKALIYQEVRLHEETPEDIAGFELIAKERLNYQMELTEGNATRLLQMTPFAWRASEKTKQQLKQCQTFSCEADFMLSIYQKSSTTQ